ncbi:MAG: hypothetical protein M1136_05340 [Chloroflexi bacterium]|nr:hypothetical protein [Chloroflexota bacterium]MCL5075061.1 hypothetical protein [Chloroflexota bacterium]
MRQSIPLAIAITAGAVVSADYFVTNTYLNVISDLLVGWVTIIAAVALLLGLLNVSRVHISAIVERKGNRFYSLCLLLTAVVIIVFGVWPGSRGPNDPVVVWIFDYIYTPLNATIFSLLAFFVASAAYRALRAHTFEATLLLLTAVIILLGQIPLASTAWPEISHLKDWLVAYPMTAGMRGIILGASLGIIATTVRALVGLDRHYLE